MGSPKKLQEFTPIVTTPYTNIVDPSFKACMHGISNQFKKIFNAHSVVILPGSGTFAMEAVARQFATNKRALVVVNGYFGYRWHEILTQGSITSKITLLRGIPTSGEGTTSYRPPLEDTVIETMKRDGTEILLLSHIDTSTGIMLPPSYIKTLAAAAHSQGAFVVLDCIASGCVWADMKEYGLDAIITAPQKAFYAPAATGIVCLSERARSMMGTEEGSTSFSLDLAKWANVMEQYESGNFAYHTTLPTTAIEQFGRSLSELEAFGFPQLEKAQMTLGQLVRTALVKRGYKSVAAPGFEGPTVLVFHCADSTAMVQLFKQEGFKIAGGFSFFLGEKEKPKTFRLGLFGLDKLRDVHGTARNLDAVLQNGGRARL
mmetsp:Transcript_8370/g.23591  ORF Transcript_8370/g.23591 Transcript_8370/m.23591 type:complete len:374 (+) Transcript_8370:197-1318(+)|eukprot:CAMPEP_0119136384 /NCGR_PEP_ID=MMETSP1310-20130426/21304_1 /TAXON_ID=464262 /ORGANISM="Genus nov. species nov., Strain RCC2339" /LENGTH=373 /DNA_ID=CAMNT_0007127367 /DNA_START=166 /DNA_END=1287 /DNA_ORIENTATION=-